MNVSSSQSHYHPSYDLRPSFRELKDEVHHLTLQTDRYEQQNINALAVTTTAGLTAAVGGALTLLETTRSTGLLVGGLGGAAFVVGLGLCAHTYAKASRSEKERLAAASALFETRRAIGRQRIKDMFS